MRTYPAIVERLDEKYVPIVPLLSGIPYQISRGILRKFENDGGSVTEIWPCREPRSVTTLEGFEIIGNIQNRFVANPTRIATPKKRAKEKAFPIPALDLNVNRNRIRVTANIGTN